MRKTDNLPPSCAVVMKSGNLNFLEACGPLQACNGTDFPFMVPNTETHFKKFTGIRAFRNYIVIASLILRHNTHIIVGW